MIFSLVRVSFFLSGFTALIYQVVWHRALMRIVGASLPATSIVFAGFMAGLAAGSLAGGFLAKRVRVPVRVYCVLELIIALCGLTFLFAADTTIPGALLHRQTGQSWVSLDLIRQSYAFILVFIPTFLMGMTLPMVTSFAQNVRAEPRKEVSILYALNLAGALFGALTAGFALVRLFGLDGSSWCASSLNLLSAALLAYASARSEGGASTFGPAKAATSLLKIPGFASSCAIVFVNSFLCLSLEVVWSRQFSMLLGSSTYSIATVLGAVLCGLFFGAWIVPRLPAKYDELKLARTFCLLVSMCLFASLFVVEHVPRMFVGLEQLLGGTQSLTSYVAPRAIICGALIAPPAFFSGAVLPLLIRRFGDHASATQCTAWLYSTSSIGAIAGALTTGLFAIPLLSQKFTSGIECMLVVCASIFALTALALLFATKEAMTKRRAPLLVLSAAFVLLPFFFRPSWNVNIMTGGIWGIPSSAGSEDARLRILDAKENKTETLFYREGKNTTVSVGSIPLRNIRYLKSDGKMEAAIPIDPVLPAPGSDLKTHTMLGLLPVLLYPRRVESALVIGYGSGATSGALLSSTAVNMAVIAELEGCVFEANQFFVPSNRDPLRQQWIDEKRVRPMEIDGRYLLSTHSGKYDIIVSQPAEPWITGAADLYTSQFFELARNRLQEGGLFCQWVQLYAIDAVDLAVLLRTFQQSFPSTCVFYPSNAGEIILVGAKESGTSAKFKIDVKELEKRLNAPSIRRALVRVGVNDVHDLLASCILDSSGASLFCKKMERESGDGRINTDDNLILEYSLPQRLSSPEGAIDANLEKLTGDAIFDLSLFDNYGDSPSEKAAFISRLSLALSEQHGSIKAFENASMALAAEAMKLSDEDEQLSRLLVTQHFGGHSLSQQEIERLALRDSSSAASLWFAEILRQMGKLEAAAGILEKAVQKSNEAILHERLAKLYLSQKKDDLAFNEFTTTLKAEPDNVEALTGAGIAALRLHKLSEAATLLKTSLDMNPDRFDVQMMYGKLLCQTGRVDEGVRHVVQSSRLEPENPAPFVFVAALYAAGGDWQGAEANLNLLRKRAPMDKRADLLAFIVYRGQGRQLEAEKFWSRYKSSPVPQSNEEVGRLIAELIEACPCDF